jgi:hypothetical protein
LFVRPRLSFTICHGSAFAPEFCIRKAQSFQSANSAEERDHVNGRYDPHTLVYRTQLWVKRSERGNLF